MYTDQTRPDQTRPDQTRPDQTRPDQTTNNNIYKSFINSVVKSVCPINFGQAFFLLWNVEVERQPLFP